MKKMRLAAAALVLGSCITLGAVPANANTTEPVTNQAPISTVQGNETNGLGCIVKLWFGIRTWCRFRRPGWVSAYHQLENDLNRVGVHGFEDRG